MQIEEKMQFSQLLEHISDSLDISETRYKEAEERYQAIGKWLGKDDSSLAIYNPDIYPQGSFRFGTVVKPVSDEDEYDIDLVCQLDIPKSNITQQHLKKIIGDRLKANETYERMLDKEGRRCWTLNYAEGAKFHMDILPAIPDNFNWLLSLNVPMSIAQYAICITDKEAWNKDQDWPRSNPKGYHEWFKDRMKTILLERKRMLAIKSHAEIEDIPDYRVKTPLQRAIQILKRHRDIMFGDDPNDKPISIIITTLAAKAYNNEANLYDAIQSIIDGMPRHIEKRGETLWIPNPVSPLENFADKWQEYPQREIKFRQWLQRVSEDLDEAMKKKDILLIGEALKPAVGERVINESLKQFAGKEAIIPTSLSKTASFSMNRFNVSHRQKPQWPVVKKGWVTVSGWATQKGLWTRQFKSDSAPLPKHCSLRFEAQTNISRPFKVYWQVVNTGSEASRANGQRGGFCDGLLEKDELFREESTLYTGMHWIECFIVKDGVCIARSGEFVVNIE